MTSFDVPIGVTEIGDNAFDGFTKLRTVNLGEVTKIGQNAFNGTKLKGEIIIPESVQSIGDGAFTDTNVTAILVSSGVDTGTSLDKNGSPIPTTGSVQFGFYDNEEILTKEWVQTHLVNGKTGIEIGPNCEEIEEGAFEGSNLTVINLSRATNLEKIGANAFAGTQITEIYLGESVMEVGEDAFKDCPLTNITVCNPNLDITPALTGVNLPALTVKADKNSATEESLRTNYPDVTINNSTGKTLVNITLVDPMEKTSKTVKIVSGIKTGINPPASDNTMIFTGYYDSADRKYFDENGKQLITISSKMTLTAKYSGSYVKIKFNANGGTGEMADLTAVIPNPVTLPKNTFVKEGFKFAGWAKTPNGFPFNDPTMDTSEFNNGDEITLYTIWKKTFTISLIGADEFETNESGEVLMPKAPNIEIPEGKVLIGYSTKENDTKPEYEAGKSYKVDSNKTIYPVFANGGIKYKVITKKMTPEGVYESTEKEFSGVEGQEITAKASVYGKDGKTIATEGEYELEDGFVLNEKDSTLSGTISKDLVLTVVLDRIKVSLTFDSNGENETMPEPIEDYWGKEIELPTLNTSLIFRGWGLTKEAKQSVKTLVLDKEGTTVYALWQDEILNFPLMASYKLMENNTILVITWEDGTPETVFLSKIGYDIKDGDNEIIFTSEVKNKTYKINIVVDADFNTKGNTATFMSAKGKKVKIPDTIKKNGKTYKVTTLSAKAFKDNKNVTSIVLGKNLTKVEDGALKGLKKLKTITFNTKSKLTLGKNSLANLKPKYIKFNTKKITCKKNALKGTKTTFKLKSKKLKKTLIKAGANKKSKFK